MGCAFSSDSPRDRAHYSGGRGPKDSRQHYNYHASSGQYGPPNQHRKRQQHYQNNIQHNSQAKSASGGGPKGVNPNHQPFVNDRSHMPVKSGSPPQSLRNDLNSSKSSQGRGISPELKDEDIHFRRQHFDRNSVLRHSKKRTRKASSASATSRNTPSKSQRSQDQAKTNTSVPSAAAAHDPINTSGTKSEKEALSTSLSSTNSSVTANQIPSDESPLRSANQPLSSAASRVVTPSNRAPKSLATGSKPSPSRHNEKRPPDGRGRRGHTPERRIKPPPDNDELENPLEECGRLI